MTLPGVRKFFILTHRWMSIVGGLLFIPWLISGIIFTFWSMPGFRNEERLKHIPPLDLSTARVEPMAAAQNVDIKPNRLRVAMHYDGRPVYRFQGTSTVYADTGEAVPGRNADQSVAFVRQLEPEHAATVRYDRLMNDIDLWTAGRRGQMPLHKIAVGDSQNTYRNRRWLYNGLHKFDLPWIYDYDRRVLWAASIVILSLGGLVLSVTTVLPMFRRLARHANRLLKWIGVKTATGKLSGRVISRTP